MSDASWTNLLLVGVPRQGAAFRPDRPHADAGLRPRERKGVYNVARLMAKRGDARLTDLRSFLSADCPKRAAFSIHAQCEAKFDPPPETRRERPTW